MSQHRITVHPVPVDGRRPSAKFSSRSADVDVIGGRVQHPIVALAGVVVVSGDLDEAFVEAEIVTDRVLPALFIILVIRKMFDDEIVDSAQSQPAFRLFRDGHHYEGVVTVRRLFRIFVLLVVGGLFRRGSYSNCLLSSSSSSSETESISSSSSASGSSVRVLPCDPPWRMSHPGCHDRTFLPSLPTCIPPHRQLIFRSTQVFRQTVLFRLFKTRVDVIASSMEGHPIFPNPPR